MEFPDAGNIGIYNDNNMDFPDMGIDDLTSINIEELIASIDQEDENQSQALQIMDPINVQPDNFPITLNGVLEEIQPNQTQVQAAQCPTSLPNIDHQSSARQESSDEMTLEEFLIDLGVIRPSPPAFHPQLEVQGHDGVVLDANNPVPKFDIGCRENGCDFPFGGSVGPYGPTVIGTPVGWNMTPIRVSSNESNWTVQYPTSTMVTHNARQRRRMIRARLRHQENSTKQRSRETSSRTA